MTGFSRRHILAAGGLTVFFAIGGRGIAQGEMPRRGISLSSASELPVSLRTEPLLDAWIRIAPDGLVSIFSGKAELGQGVGTALLQIAADELDVSPEKITLVTADTHRTPDEGITSGSLSIHHSGTAIASAAANVRHRLMVAAAARWNLQLDKVSTKASKVCSSDGRNIGYGELVGSLDLHIAADPDIRPRSTGEHRLIGTSLPRIDLHAKLTGGSVYVHDMVLPGMLHARVIRGPVHGTSLVAADVNTAAPAAGLEVVRDGNFIALVGRSEWQLVQAWQKVVAAESMRMGPPPAQSERGHEMEAVPSRPRVIVERQEAIGPEKLRTFEARYTRPYLLHGAIGPSCAVALYDGVTMTIWTHSQGVFPLRRALASLLRMPLADIHCVHVEGAGCFGHNGADDVAADAALVARALPGRPVRMLWMREQEHGWEPLGPAMVARLSASLDAAGSIVAWSQDTWSVPHTTRPVTGGDFLAGSELVPALAPSPPFEIPQPEGGGDRNIVPLYRFPNVKLVSHFLPDMPVRVSALRALGAHLNVFAIESFMDELAAAAGRDPIEFRLAHLDDVEAREVIKDAASRLGWDSPRENRSMGIGFARYKNSAAYCAVGLDIELDARTLDLTLHRVIASVNCGQAVNPDGVRNQIEGGIVQALSWTMHEQVAFDAGRRGSSSWADYRIARFGDVPLDIEVNILERAGAPFLGTGEAAQGPAAAALANAVSRALGNRVRDMPFTRENLQKSRASPGLQIAVPGGHTAGR